MLHARAAVALGNKPLQRTPSIIQPPTMCGTHAGTSLRRAGPLSPDSGQRTSVHLGLPHAPLPFSLGLVASLCLRPAEKTPHSHPP